MSSSRHIALLLLALVALFAVVASADKVEIPPFYEWCKDRYSQETAPYDCANPPANRLHAFTFNSEHVTTCNSGDLPFTCVMDYSGDLDTMGYKEGLGQLQTDYCAVVERNASASMQRREKPADHYMPGSCIPTIRNQGSCASCYIPPVLGAVEIAVCRQTPSHVLSTLSFQEALDCAPTSGCGGGHHYKVIAWMAQNYELTLESAYSSVYNPNNPIKGAYCASGMTSQDDPFVKLTVHSMSIIKEEEQLIDAVYNTGSAIISWSVDQYFMYYGRGIFDGGLPINNEPFQYLGNIPNPRRCMESNIVNHVMLVFGYEVDYVWAQNSWGTRWGVDGKIRIIRGSNVCNMYRYAVSLDVEKL